MKPNRSTIHKLSFGNCCQ